MQVGRRCFVSNLAWRTSWQDLKDKFRECGKVVYTNVMRDEEGRLHRYVSFARGGRVTTNNIVPAYACTSSALYLK